MSTLRNQARNLILVSIIIFEVFLMIGCASGASQVNQTDSEKFNAISDVDEVESGTPLPEAMGIETGSQLDDIDRALLLQWDFHAREMREWHGHADYYSTRRAPSPEDYLYGSPFQGSPVPKSIVLPDLCNYTAKRNVNCRESDYSESSVIAILMQGEDATLLYMNPTFTHGKFEIRDSYRCWIPLALMDGSTDPLQLCKVYVVNAPPMADVSTHGANSPTCSSELDEPACIAAGGTWVEGGAAAKSECRCS